MKTNNLIKLIIGIVVLVSIGLMELTLFFTADWFLIILLLAVAALIFYFLIYKSIKK